LTISLLDDHTLEIKGEITIDVRNFNVDPPKLLMVKVHPEVKAKLQVVAKE
jgi:hypothetical protein